ncbi:MAG TPA: RNA polymerase sigma factor [Acidimicrobiales bacterium]
MEPSGSLDNCSDPGVISSSLREPAAFGEIFDRYVVDITRFLARRSNPEFVEDLVAETFVTAFRVRHSFDVQRLNARPWLYGIATNVLRHHFRGELRRARLLTKWSSRAVTQDRESDAEFADAENRIEVGRRRTHVEAALASLDPAARDALLLFAYAGLTYQEIAYALDTPVGTVRSRISRSRHKLRELLSSEGATKE